MKKIVLFLFQLFFTFLLSAQSLTDSLKLHFPFSGNGQDASGYGHNATIYGPTLVADRLGNPNSAYYFDGTSDYMDYLTSSQLRPASLPVSISAWIKCATPPASGSGGYIIMDTEHNASNGNYSGFWLAIYPGTGALQINFGNNAGACSGPFRRTFDGTINVCDGQWHLITVVVNGATNMKIYVDCQLDNGTYSGTGALNPIYSSAPTAKVGDFLCGLTNTVNKHFKGTLDELRFYHRALSQSDIAALYNYPTTVNGNLAAGILGNDTTICTGNLQLDATSTWATSYLWSNGSTAPVLNVSTSGTYWVQINGMNCGQNGRDTIVIMAGNSSANLFPDTIVCKNQTIVLDAGGGFSAYSWNTGATTQTISTNVGGQFIVQALNSSTCIVVDTINVSTSSFNVPFAQFTTTSLPSGNLQITNTSLYTTIGYSWIFSTGSTDTATNPQYVFPCNVPVTVTLICYGHCGSDTTVKTITNLCDAIEDITQLLDLRVFPQPAESVVHIEYIFNKPENAKIRIYNTLGQLVFEEDTAAEVGKVQHKVEVQKWTATTYFLQIITQKGMAIKKIVLDLFPK